MKRSHTATPPGVTLPAWMVPFLRFAVQHWLALFTALVGLYCLLALAAPVCMVLGWTRMATAIYHLYSHTCHQLPAASYFVLGTEAAIQTGRDLAGIPMARSFVGEATVGYKTALCQRNLAIYGSWFLLGLGYAVTGRRLPPLPFWAGGLLMVPMAADGLSQMLGLHTSYWLLRSITGLLFSMGLAWTLWPRIQQAMMEVDQVLGHVSSG